MLDLFGKEEEKKIKGHSVEITTDYATRLKIRYTLLAKCII